jgi:drug/metabolite transporter (DMT)-like permease
MFLYSLALLPEATPATLGFYTAPLWTAALAHFILRERVGLWFLPASAGLLIGGYLTLFGWRTPPTDYSVLGLALAIGSGLVWAIYSVALRKSAPGLPLKPFMGACFILGAVWFAVLALVLEGPPAVLHQTTGSWLRMAVYVAIPTLASFILFNAAMQRAPASTVNLLVGAELGFTAIFAYLLNHDPFTAAQVGGLALVLVSVTFYLWIQGRRAPIPQNRSHS